MTRWHCHHTGFEYVCGKCAPYITAAYTTPPQPVASSALVTAGGAS